MCLNLCDLGIDDDNITAIIHDTIHLSCYPKSYSGNNFEWKFINESGHRIPLEKDESYNLGKKFTLIIRSVDKMHQGNYTVFDQGSEICKIQLKVQDVETVTMHSEIGQIVNLPFPNPSGDLRNKYYWVKVTKDKKIRINNSARYEIGFHNLRINKVRKDDNTTFEVRTIDTDNTLHKVKLIVIKLKAQIIKGNIGKNISIKVRSASKGSLYRLVKVSKNSNKVIKESRLLSGNNVKLHEMTIKKNSYGMYSILENGKVIHKLKLMRAAMK